MQACLAFYVRRVVHAVWHAGQHRDMAREMSLMSVGVHLLGLRLCVCLVCVPAPPVFLNFQIVQLYCGKAILMSIVVFEAIVA